MSKPLRAAVIGCGRMGAYTRAEMLRILPKGWLPHNHAAAISAVEGVELVAVCDCSIKAAQAAAEQYGVDAVYDDYAKLLDEQHLDIVSVATRTDVRPAIIRQAVAAGTRGIHAEKPLCRSLAEGKEVATAISDANVGFTYGVYRRYMEAYKTAKEIIDSGELGELWQVSIAFGKANVLWSLPHATDLMLYFSGASRAEWVTASVLFGKGKVTTEWVDDDPVVENGVVKFDNGVIGLITATDGLSVTASLSGGEVTVGADGAWVEIRRPNSGVQSGYRLTSQTILPEPEKSGMQVVFEELRERILHDAPQSITLDTVLEGQRVLFAMVLSELHGGGRFPVKDVPDDFTVTGRIGKLYA